jgi:quinol monooxygenase YgiN
MREEEMSVYSVWESHFSPDAAEEGRQITEAIWRDMPAFEGYRSHELIEDLDDPGHLFVVSQWTTREHADASLREYADHANVRRVNELVSRPRARFVGHGAPSAA